MSDNLYNFAINEIKGLSEELYDAAAPAHLSENSIDSAPLFHDLERCVERYTDPQLIGSGGMKEVYKVYDAHMARHVAMAKPLEKLNEDYFDPFLREAHITAGLEHPSIINLFDMGIDNNNRPFFTMELKKGKSLRQLYSDRVKSSSSKGQNTPRSSSQKRNESAALKDKFNTSTVCDISLEVDSPISEFERVSIILRVCEALAYAHSQGVLHLDIKPENIQVGTFGEVQVCDWGMGVVITPEEEQNETEVLLDPDLYGSLQDHIAGTPGYMAPELSDPRAPKTVKMDIFAVGCLMKELFSDIYSESTDNALSAIISKACNNTPELRYDSIDSLRNDLLRYSGGYSTSAEKVGILRELKLFYHRNSIICTVASLFMAIVIIGTSIFISQLTESRNRAEKASKKYLGEKRRSKRRLHKQIVKSFDLIKKITNPQVIKPKTMPDIVKRSQILLNDVISNNPPPDSYIYLQKFELSFISQNLKEALAALPAETYQLMRQPESSERNVVDLIAIAEKYKDQQTSKQLTAETLIKIIRDLAVHGNKHYSLIEKMLIYNTYNTERPLNEQREIIKAVIQMLNPDSTNISITYSEGKVAIEGDSITRLTFPDNRYNSDKSILYLLNVTHLDIHKTAIKSSKELAGLSLEELDIRDLAIETLVPLEEMRTLRRIIVTPEQFSPHRRAAYANDFTFIMKTK